MDASADTRPHVVRAGLERLEERPASPLNNLAPLVRDDLRTELAARRGYDSSRDEGRCLGARTRGQALCDDPSSQTLCEWSPRLDVGRLPVVPAKRELGGRGVYRGGMSHVARLGEGRRLVVEDAEAAAETAALRASSNPTGATPPIKPMLMKMNTYPAVSAMGMTARPRR